MYPISFVGGPLREDFVYYKISMPSHAGLSRQPELKNPTHISFSLPCNTLFSHITYIPEINVNMKILNIDIRNNILNICLAWWSNSFDLYVGFK